MSARSAKPSRHEPSLRGSLPVKGEATCFSPSVGQGLHELAEHRQADLLVMGSCRRGLIGRVFVTDDTQAALNGAPCAVAVASAWYAGRAGEMREIGVGYTASPEGRHALAVARELAAERCARLSAFEAVSLPAYYFTGPALPVGDAIEGCALLVLTHDAAAHQDSDHVEAAVATIH
jgi:nucleotide-binding universal stress UspA family protein